MIIRFIIKLLLLALLTGCAVSKPQMVRSPDSMSRPTASDSYYYYLQALYHNKAGDIDGELEALKQAVDLDPNTALLNRELAAAYFEKNQTETALKLIKKVVRKHPDDIESLVLYARLLDELEREQEAKIIYRKVVDLDPSQEGALLRLGSIYMDGGELENASYIYLKVVDQFPYSYVGYFFLGKIHVQQGNLDQAEGYYVKTLELAPGLEEPRYELLRIYETQDRIQDIAGIYQDILKHNPLNIQIALELSEFYLENELPKDAEPILRELGTKSTSERSVVREVIENYLDQSNFKTAAFLLEGMLKGAPENSELHYLAGIAQDGAGDQRIAITHFLQVDFKSRYYQSAAVQVALILQELGEVDNAIDQMGMIIGKLPDNPDLYLYLASFYEDIAQYEKAETALSKGLDINPNHIRSHFKLGVIYDKWGKKNRSIQAMKTVLALDPKHTNALNYLGYTYADLGIKLDEAEQLIKTALKVKPNDGYITDSLGWVYYKKGEIDQALMTLEKAYRLVSDDPIILEHLGDIYMELNMNAKALDFYQRSRLLKKNDTANIDSKIRTLNPNEPEAQGAPR